MTLLRIFTEAAPKAIGPYSQASVANGMVFTSGMNQSSHHLTNETGQIPLDVQGNLVQGDIQVQTKQVLDNLRNVLLASGSDFPKVIKTTVFLKDMNDFAKMNETYESMFGDTKPSRSAVQVARLPRDVLVEIEAIALTYLLFFVLLLLIIIIFLRQ